MTTLLFVAAVFLALAGATTWFVLADRVQLPPRSHHADPFDPRLGRDLRL